jgi:signal transduction histidine kinase
MDAQSLPTGGNLTVAELPLWRQFRFTLILAFILLALLPLMVIAALATSRQIDTIRQLLNRQLESVVELKTGQVELWLNQADLAFDYLLQDADFRERLTTLIATHVHAADEMADPLNARITALLDVNPYFERFIVYAPEGEILLASEVNDLGKLVRLQPFYAPSLEQERYLQPPFFDLSTTALTMMLTQQLRGDDGAVIGVFAAELNLAVLGRIMTERTGLGETGETYLASRQNNYLLTPSRFEGYVLTQAYNSEAITAALEGRNGSGTYDNYQRPPQRVIGVYRWIPELEAGLIAEVNETQALTGVRDAQLNIVVLGVVTAAAAVLGGLIYANRIAQPVVQLTTAAAQYASGNLKARAEVRSRNEIGALATAFNTMAEQIDERQTELAELNQNLEKRVAQRTVELKIARDDALAAQRIAIENSRLKSEFLSTMSHELRTPLNAIEGFTSIMLSGMGIELSARAEDMVRRVSSNSRRLLQLINDFLDLSRIEAGRMELIDAPISPEALARKWQSQVGVLAQEKGLEFEVIVDPDLPETLLADEDALSKITLNLLSNAFKFTQQGKVELHLQATTDGWAISVRDTGIGIPPYAREYIFEEFRQVDGSSKRLYGGTGLGLSLVQKLTRAMGGSVSLESEMGQGSTFTIALPLKISEGAEGVPA